MYLNTKSDVEMKIHGSVLDVDNFEFESAIKGFSFNRLIWTKKFGVVVNNDNSLVFTDKDLKLEAKCEPY